MMRRRSEILLRKTHRRRPAKSFRSDARYQSPEQGAAAWNVVNDDVFVSRVCAIAVNSQSIENRNT